MHHNHQSMIATINAAIKNNLELAQSFDNACYEATRDYTEQQECPKELSAGLAEYRCRLLRRQALQDCQFKFSNPAETVLVAFLLLCIVISRLLANAAQQLS